MRKPQLLFIAFILFACFNVNGQQDPFLYSTGRITPTFNNPASFGVENRLGVNMVYRNQWDGMERAPNTFAVLTDFSHEKDDHKIGYGASYYYETIGFMYVHSARIVINYGYTFGENEIYVGLAPGIFHVVFDPNWLPPTSTPDPSLPLGSDGSFDLDAGITFRRNNFFAGLSSTHLLTPTLTYINFQVRRHYNLFTRYDANFNEFKIQPIVIVKMDGTTSTFQLLSNISYKQDLIGLTLGYRRSDSFIVGAFSEFYNFNLSYQYGIMTNPLNQYGKGTHEIRLGYNLRK